MLNNLTEDVTMQDKANLPQCVRKNLYRIRKVLKVNQDDFAAAMGLQRTGYTKKEVGTTPITLEDLESIMNAYPQITLPDLLLGCPSMGQAYHAIGLEEAARQRFPYLEQVILTANLVANDGDDKDLGFLQRCLEYAVLKLGIGKGPRKKMVQESAS